MNRDKASSNLAYLTAAAAAASDAVTRAEAKVAKAVRQLDDATSALAEAKAGLVAAETDLAECAQVDTSDSTTATATAHNAGVRTESSN